LASEFSAYSVRNMASSTQPTTKPPLPPFTKETAQIKVKAAQDLWNTRYLSSFPFLSLATACCTFEMWPFWKQEGLRLRQCRNPSLVKNGYTSDSIWRNRSTFLKGHDEIVEFLTKKWSVENGYRLRKELFAFTDNKVGHVNDIPLTSCSALFVGG
jgi:nuclear transport factor 2 (NTF2) superfamily protein